VTNDFLYFCGEIIYGLLTWYSSDCVVTIGTQMMIGMRRSTLRLFQLTTAESAQTH